MENAKTTLQPTKLRQKYEAEEGRRSGDTKGEGAVKKRRAATIPSVRQTDHFPPLSDLHHLQGCLFSLSAARKLAVVSRLRLESQPCAPAFQKIAPYLKYKTFKERHIFRGVSIEFQTGPSKPPSDSSSCA